MKSAILILIVYSCLFTHIVNANKYDQADISVAENIEQRSEAYQQYESIQSSETDSIKLIYAKQVLKTDEEILSKAIALDTLQMNLHKKLNSYEVKAIAEKKIFYIACGIGAFVLLLFVIILILFLRIRSKNSKNKNEYKKIQKQLEINITELNSIKLEKVNNEAAFNDSTEKIQNELRLKNEVISNLESKFIEYSRNEISFKNLLNDTKIDLEKTKEKEMSLITNYNDLNEKFQTLKTTNDELIKKISAISEEIEESKKTIETLTIQKQLSENNLKIAIENKEKEEEADKLLIADGIKLAEENKLLVQKIEYIQNEKLDLVLALKRDVEEKEKLFNKIYALEDEIYELKLRIPEQQIEALKEMIEQNIETLKLSNTKLSVEKEQLEKALRMREPEDILVQKINKLIEENYNLQLDLEDEKNYAEKLNEKLDKYLDELEKQDLKLELLSIKVQDRTIPENRIKYDELDLNLVKIEKLNRLKEMMAISEEEYQQMKINIITNI